ncbi:hypothetical protein [Lachnoclostridium phytofermentans]|uniref:Uncharacterized protein n=1 Tax=Lachnoclostridium phytofermentans (strain ATCC 700394 / DSM 18823 / ISDg) TaxID=357809 RepID=A9KIX4_LACP7|nr:hypothetical protein [Lachnoclostridium phytofermentans]ABX40973.1 hypothetical protein Cphy_0586 [Lachnoclostridium phytofermentans ISDg]
MRNTNTDLIDELTDDDIKILIKSDDLGNLLEPIKRNTKHYAKYKAMLGNMDKKSILVEKFLPKVVFELYKKKDFNYYKYLNDLACKKKYVFKSMIEEVFGNNFKITEVEKFTLNDYSIVFKHILKDKNSKLDFDLLYLQMKLFNITIADNLKNAIEMEWNRLSILQETKKEVAVTLAMEFEQKQEEVLEQFKREKDVLKNRINILTTQCKELQEELHKKENIIISLNKQNDLDQTKISLLEDNIQIKENEKGLLNKKILDKQEKLEQLEQVLKKKTEDFYNDINKLWKQENEQLVRDGKNLENEISIYRTQIEQLDSEIKTREEKIIEWDKYVNTYVEHLEQKLLEKKLESILFHQSMINDKDKLSEKYIPDVYDEVFVIEGSIDKELEPCKDYYDYVQIVETNLSNAGEKMGIGLVSDIFNAAINTGLSPLICGFNARRIALALTAARYGEKSEIIAIPVGFNKTKALLEQIEQAQTHSVIIEDAFGTLNEKMLLPILRCSIDKVLIFTAENNVCLQYVPRYFYNYMQLISIDRQENINININVDIYAKANHLFKSIQYTGIENGHKLARYIFGDISLDNAYVMRRGNLFTELEQAYMENSEEDVLKKYFIAEAKWLLSEEEKERINNIIDNNTERFSNKLVELLRR